jgi:hypothetical protein
VLQLEVIDLRGKLFGSANLNIKKRKSGRRKRKLLKQMISLKINSRNTKDKHDDTMESNYATKRRRKIREREKSKP